MSGKFPHARRGAAAAMLAAATLGLVCACDGGQPATDSTAPASAATSPAPATPSSPVTVPPAYTPVTVRPLSASTFPVKGTDGKYHVAYDLELTNATPVPATIRKLDVVDAAHPDTVIASFSGTALVDPNCGFGNCNRLRTLPSSPAPNTSIPPQQARALLVDLTFASLAQAPKTVLQHLYVTGAAGPPAKRPTPLDYLAAPFDISAGTPRVIAPPLRGTNWVAVNGCCQIGFPHRQSLLPLNGALHNSQRFAIDWKRANDQGEFYTGDKTRNASYADYGADILAVADGTITATLDDMAANAPGTLPASDPKLASKLTVNNVDGNHIVEDIGGGAWAMYAHLQKGSLLVKPGDKVHAGQVIAKLGNTGNANASHLHFQLMDGPNLIGSDALPYVIDHFSYAGQVSLKQIADADDYLTGRFFSGHLAHGQPRTDELPLNGNIVDFPR